MGIVIAITLVIITVVFFAFKESSHTVVTGDNQLYTQKICTLPGNMVRVEINDKGVTTRLEKEGDKWFNLDYEELIYDDWAFHLWLTDLRNVIGEKIESSNDETNNIYDELTIITIYDEMNNSQTFKVNRDKNQNMYVDTDDIDGVYAIPNDSKGTFSQNVSEFVVNTITIPDITQEISIEAKKTSTFTKQDDEWIIGDFYAQSYRGNSEAVDKLVSDISGIKIKDYEGILTEQNDYGISQSKLKITIDNETILEFGDVNQNKIYVKLNGETPFVYSIPYEKVKHLESIDVFKMLNREIIDINMDSKNEIVLENPQGKYVFEIGYEDEDSQNLSEEQVETTDNNESLVEELDNNQSVEEHIPGDNEASLEHKSDNNEVNNTISKLNNKEITIEQAEELVELINRSVYLEVVLQHPGIEQKEDRPAESTITFTNSSGEIDKIEFIPYDINYYLLRMNGAIEFAVNKDRVTTLFSRLNTLAK